MPQYKFTCPTPPNVGGANDTCIVMQILAKVHHVGVAVSGNEVIISSRSDLTQHEKDLIANTVRAHNGDHLRKKHEARLAATREQATVHNLTGTTTDEFLTALLAREKLRSLHWERLE